MKKSIFFSSFKKVFYEVEDEKEKMRQYFLG